jgi:FMN reductase
VVRAVVGNPNPGGRTTTVAEAVAEAVAGLLDGASTETIELADVAPHLFEWGNETVAALTKKVASSTVNVFACPTYKATYTGLLKAFLDNYGNDGLAGTVAVPVMVGGTPRHALAPEVHLRPLLVELGASVPTRGLFVLDSELDGLGHTIEEWLNGSRDDLARLAP